VGVVPGEVRGNQMIGHQPRFLLVTSHLVKNGLNKGVQRWHMKAMSTVHCYLLLCCVFVVFLIFQQTMLRHGSQEVNKRAEISRCCKG
jgi:SNF family Na+-dependent transporter